MWAFLLAILAGVVLPIQSGINSTLKLHVGHPIWAALFSFATGGLALLIVAAGLRLPMPPLSGAPLWNWSGGLLGMLYVTLAIVLVPRIGAAQFIALAVTGQLLMSVILDHFGWLGVPQHAISPSRVVGAILLLGGVYLLSQK